MPKNRPRPIIPTEEEDKEITRQAIKDGTLMTDEQLEQMKPISEFPELKFLTKRGRPPKENPKKQITLRLDQDILTFFKKQGKGYQSRINAALRSYINQAG